MYKVGIFYSAFFVNFAFVSLKAEVRHDLKESVGLEIKGTDSKDVKEIETINQQGLVSDWSVGIKEVIL